MGFLVSCFRNYYETTLLQFVNSLSLSFYGAGNLFFATVCVEYIRPVSSGIRASGSIEVFGRGTMSISNIFAISQAVAAQIAIPHAYLASYAWVSWVGLERRLLV
jgi:hypothetical protein